MRLHALQAESCYSFHNPLSEQWQSLRTVTPFRVALSGESGIIRQEPTAFSTVALLGYRRKSLVEQFGESVPLHAFRSTVKPTHRDNYQSARQHVRAVFLEVGVRVPQ